MEEPELVRGNGHIDPGGTGSGRLVPLNVDGQRIYLCAQESAGTYPSGERPEEEIAWRPPTLEQALDGLVGVARAMGTRLRRTEASKATVEFGCEFVLESGSFVAVIGKTSGKSTFKVALEWTNPAS
jgi:hypothetical protein